RSSPADAVAALNKYANQLSVKERATAWSLIALQASYKLSPEALDYWRRTGGISLTNVGYEWKARIALRNGQWDMLRETIAAMPAPLRADSTWIYWLARVYRQQHDAELANKLFESIADENH